MLPFIWFYRYNRIGCGGTLRIGKFFRLCKYKNEKYIKPNGGKKYSLTIMDKMIKF